MALRARRFLLYAARWQLSSPILALCLAGLGDLGIVWATIIANFVGACVFYFIDKRIFKENKWKS